MGDLKKRTQFTRCLAKARSAVRKVGPEKTNPIPILKHNSVEGLGRVFSILAALEKTNPNHRKRFCQHAL
jgi:hypothetical protein